MKNVRIGESANLVRIAIFSARTAVRICCCILVAFVLPAAAAEIHYPYRPADYSNGPTPESIDISLVEPLGYRYSRWVGCEFEKLGFFQISFPTSEPDLLKCIPQEAAADIKAEARRLGGDAALIFRISCPGPSYTGGDFTITSATAEVQVVRRIDPECEPFLLFVTWVDDDRDFPKYPVEFLSKPIDIAPDRENAYESAFKGLGSLADSVRALSGDAVLVEFLESAAFGEVFRFVEQGCWK